MVEQALTDPISPGTGCPPLFVHEDPEPGSAPHAGALLLARRSWPPDSTETLPAGGNRPAGALSSGFGSGGL